MIKLVLFDLDGVLFDSREMHFETLNAALLEYAPKFQITLDDHHQRFNGLPTKKKLEILVNDGLDSSLCDLIFSSKQSKTSDWISKNVKPVPELTTLFSNIKNEGIKIGVVSNAISETVSGILTQTSLLEFVDVCLSNEHVKKPKPDPQCYLSAMALMSTSCHETLIVEDSEVGIASALASSANVFHVSSASDLISSHECLLKAIKKYESSQHKSLINILNMNIVIPMAGMGSRFKDAGYKKQKPMIDVLGRPMIQVVTDSIGIKANYIFIARKQKDQESSNEDVEHVLGSLNLDHKMIMIDQITDGAARTVLLAEKYIDNDQPLLIVNSDQYIEWNYVSFIQKVNNMNADAGILTFKAHETKWSFVKIESDGYVSEVAEKQPISDDATVGVYYWRSGSDFVKYANQMISKNKRVNNEYYVSPVFNEAIADGKKIIAYQVKKMEGLGTPEDLQNFIMKRTRN